MLTVLARFSHHLAGRRAALAAVFALGLVGAAVTLALPLLGKAFVDAVTGREFTIVPAIAAAMLALAAVDLALTTVSHRVHAQLSADVLASLRASLFDRCVHGTLDHVESFRHGDLLTRFGTDVPRIQVLLVDGFLGGIQNLLFLAAAAIVTFVLSPALAAWSFLGLALALGATAAFRRPVERRSARVREAMADLAHFLSERLSALRAIRFHRTETDEAQRLEALNTQLNREVVGFQLQDALTTGVPGLLLAASLAWIYVVGGSLLEDGTISLGTFVAFVLYQGRLFAPANGLLALARNVQQAQVSLARVAEVLATESDDEAGGALSSSARGVASAQASAPEAIVATGVCFAYQGKPPILHDLDLRVRNGERIAIFGASGAGKSTLVQLLFGLRRPDVGSILVAGLPPHARADRVLGHAGAEPFLLHATVEENLRYANPDACRAEIDRAATLAEADAFIRALPEGYATMIGGRGLALSDGQRQRLGLARLVLQDPSILVLDEAFCCLDLETEARIRRTLWRAFAGRSIVSISHRPVDLEAFDRLLYLEGGALVAIAPDALRARLATERRFSAQPHAEEIVA